MIRAGSSGPRETQAAPRRQASTAKKDIVLRPFSQSLPMALLRAREAAMKEFRPLLRRHGLTEQQWRVLRALEAVPSEITALAAATYLLGPSLSRILPQLERRRLIRRRAHADDLRRATISITAGGMALINQVTPQSIATYRRIEGAFGERRLQQLQVLLVELEAALDGKLD